ncbi:MAG: cupredoxin domain-containing protein [Blastococcus sp.]
MTRRTAVPLLLAVALLTAGCAASPSRSVPSSSASAPASSLPSSTSPSATDRIKGTEIVVAVKNGKVSPPTHRVQVTKDTHVRLIVTSDTADEVHVHGYDIEKELAPGKPTTLRFTADVPGVFEVELHKANLVILRLQVG